MKILAFTLFFFAMPVLAQTTRQLDSHNHGEAELNVAIEGNQISLALLSPAANLVGFEHAPKNTEQQATIDSAKEMLANAAAVIQFPAEAQCGVDTSSVHWTLEEGLEHKEHDEHDEHKEHDEHDEHDEDESTHSEYEAEYLFTCADATLVDSIEVKLFEQFPLFEKIRVQGISGDKQFLEELTASNSTIKIAP